MSVRHKRMCTGDLVSYSKAEKNKKNVSCLSSASTSCSSFRLSVWFRDSFDRCEVCEVLKPSVSARWIAAHMNFSHVKLVDR